MTARGAGTRKARKVWLHQVGPGKREWWLCFADDIGVCNCMNISRPATLFREALPRRGKKRAGQTK